MTKKEYFNAIIEKLTGCEDATDLIDFCEAQIEALDKKADKARASAAAKKAADPLLDVVAAALDNDFATADDILARLDGVDTTVAKVRARLTKLVDSGVAVKEDVKVDKRTLKAYRLA